MSILRAALVLGRVSNLPTVWSNVLAGWFLAGGAWSPGLAWTLAGGSLLYVGGMTLNDAFDAEWDRQHAPERPIPAGVISASVVWMSGFLYLAAGSGLLLLLTETHWGWVLALNGAVLLYDWLHKRWAGSVWIMGACRFLLYVLAASASGEGEPWELAWIAGAGMGLYIVGLTTVARSERVVRKSAAKWLGVIAMTGALAAAAIIWLAGWRADDPAFDGRGWIGEGHTIYLFLALNAGLLVWVGRLTNLKRKGAVGAFVALALAGIVLYDASILILQKPVAGLICLAFFPLNLLLQRRIPAT